MNKIFNCRKYCLSRNRWVCTTIPNTALSHDVWNYYYPDDPILKDEVIHHKNGDPSDDRIENLQKMKRGDHSSLHTTGLHWTLSEKTKQKIREIMLDNQYGLGKHWSLSGKTKQKMRDSWTDEKKGKKSSTMLGNTNNKEGKNQYSK